MGWYNYGARFYDAVLGRFTSTDPLSATTPRSTPYRYGFNNPLIMIDPTGMTERPHTYTDGYGTISATASVEVWTDSRGSEPENDYKLNQDGTVKLIKKTDDETDKLFSYHLDGSPTGESLELDKGILENYKNNEKAAEDPEGDPFSFVEINNDSKATVLFEFLAEHTIVEFGLTKYDDNKSIITTSHKFNQEGGGNKMAYDKMLLGSQIRERIHSHPTDGEPSPADKSGASYWKGIDGQNVTMKIYKVISKQYVTYE